MFTFITCKVRSLKTVSSSSRQQARASLSLEPMKGRQLLSAGIAVHFSQVGQALIESRGAWIHHGLHTKARVSGT